MVNRADPSESFHVFANRHDDAALTALAEAIEG
jgi:hypothetical protein